jgi:hypothetical protein
MQQNWKGLILFLNKSAESCGLMLRKVVLFLALFFVALTSGAAFAVWLDSSPFGLSPNFYAEKMQHAIRVQVPAR